MCWNCSQTLIRLLRRHLPRRGRQSAAAGIWVEEDRGEGRIEMSAPTRDGVGVWFCFGKWDIEWWGKEEGASGYGAFAARRKRNAAAFF